ncbi:hypothetical protein NHX12_027881 [Muraenolepis orangiensis]|uniref:Uncharacterized protein n=1 Tax=Muraenolepis orangiensis TaxID=630683 RepID=A0A9Q0EJU8_9TELE|nr:hypothetical protein NHX12_027881 [Muraenolepis orangiensis]
MRGFGMGGQQFRQFFSAGARNSLLGPVPMGMTMKSPLMGFPGARHYHPHQRFYNNNNASSSTTRGRTIVPRTLAFGRPSAAACPLPVTTVCRLFGPLET